MKSKIKNRNLIVIILVVVAIIMFIIAIASCTRKNFSDNGWKEESFFGSVLAPSDKLDRFSQDYNVDGKENYTVIVNDFSYGDFYDYIMELEKDGFHYEFVDEYVPKKASKLADKTETSWSASKDGIYIIANWRSDDNPYYNGYNLQLLFYNYNYANINN